MDVPVTAPESDKPSPPPTYADECLARAAKATPGPWDEIWKDIPGCEGYQVSDFGNVKSRVRKGNHTVRLGQEYRLLKKQLRSDKRYTVALPLGKNGNNCHKFISHLVMLAFVGPRPEGLEVAHLNGDSTDDRLINLKYCTHIENEKHKIQHGTIGVGEKNSQATLLGWQVDEIRYLASKAIPQAKIAALFDLDHRQVSHIVSGTTWQHHSSRTDVVVLAKRLNEALEILRETGTHLDDRYMQQIWALEAPPREGENGQ